MHLVANTLGGAADFWVRAVLQKHGLVDNRDYTLTEPAFPTLVGLLLDGKADLVAMTAPFVYDPKLKAKAHVLFTLESLARFSSSSRLASGPASMLNQKQTDLGI